MGGKALEGLHKGTEDIKSSIKEGLKVRCGRRFDFKRELASDVAEKVSSSISSCTPETMLKVFIFVPRAMGCTLEHVEEWNYK